MIDLSTSLNSFFTYAESFLESAKSFFCMDYERKSELTLARVIFLVEDHSSLNDREKNVQYLFSHYLKERQDIIYVEEDATKNKEQLTLTQLGLFKEKDINVEGWDDHCSCLEREKTAKSLKEIENSIHKLAMKTLPLGWEHELAYLKKIALQVQVSEWKNFNGDFQNCFLQNSPQKGPLLEAMVNYVKSARNFLAYKHFEVRQKALEEKIQEGLLKTSGKIFVIAGRKHLEEKDDKLQSFVLQMLNTIGKGNYLIY